jgi:hypothetical protein
MSKKKTFIFFKATMSTSEEAQAFWVKCEDLFGAAMSTDKLPKDAPSATFSSGRSPSFCLKTTCSFAEFEKVIDKLAEKMDWDIIFYDPDSTYFCKTGWILNELKEPGHALAELERLIFDRLRCDSKIFKAFGLFCDEYKKKHNMCTDFDSDIFYEDESEDSDDQSSICWAEDEIDSEDDCNCCNCREKNGSGSDEDSDSDESDLSNYSTDWTEDEDEDDKKCESNPPTPHSNN